MLCQVSTLNTLANGDYLGHDTVRELKSHGDTGSGTFNYMDGKIVIKNGIIYQIKFT
ncbi:acetolactate decarboxylase [Methanobacterium alcaliphilum]|uniref:acetolactate decarboxylase n=1 Tax=Methanobacterium alcaliphilum TaxID=392018 RepID=UPI003CCC181A